MPIFLGKNGPEAKEKAFDKLREDICLGGGKLSHGAERNFSAKLLSHIHKAAEQLQPPSCSWGPTPSKTVKIVAIAQYEVLVLYGYTPADFGFGSVR